MKSELPKHLRRKYVTRASFAKMQGEKQRLERDIRTLITGSIPEIISVKRKYTEKYKFWDDIAQVLRVMAKKELPLLNNLKPRNQKP